jgi:hypothetical protein
MIETIIGAIIGAAVTLIISELYYKRSSKDLNKQVVSLESKVTRLDSLIHNLEEWQKVHFDSLQTIKKHAVAGTIDDPDYPYK